MSGLIKKRKSSKAVIRMLSAAAALFVISAAASLIIVLNHRGDFQIAEKNSITADTVSESASSVSGSQDSVLNTAKENAATKDAAKSDERKTADEYDAAEEIDNNTAANEGAASATTQTYSTTFVREGRTVMLSSENADEVGAFVGALLSSGSITLEPEGKAVSDEEAEYSITVISLTSVPVAYDESGVPLNSLTMNISGSRGSVKVTDSGREYCFTLSSPDSTVSELEQLIR